jgi:hypothetical protein
MKEQLAGMSWKRVSIKVAVRVLLMLGSCWRISGGLSPALPSLGGGTILR